jgi:hypothetical protein
VTERRSLPEGGTRPQLIHRGVNYSGARCTPTTVGVVVFYGDATADGETAHSWFGVCFGNFASGSWTAAGHCGERAALFERGRRRCRWSRRAPLARPMPVQVAARSAGVGSVGGVGRRAPWARPPPVSVERVRVTGANAVCAGRFRTRPYDASQSGDAGQQSSRRSSSAARPLDVLELLAWWLRRRLGVAEPAVTVLWDSVRRGPPSAHGRPVTARLVHGSSTRCSCMPQSKAVTKRISDAY